MSAEPNEFETLRKLLALKKHEAPPPGYFDRFAREVRTRLAAGEHQQTNVWQQLGEEASWLQRLWGAFADRPALAGAFGVAACAVMLAGIYLAQQPDLVSSPAVAETWKAPMPGAAVSALTPLMAGGTNPAPAVPAGGSLFDRPGGSLQAVPVGFQPSGN